MDAEKKLLKKLKEERRKAAEQEMLSRWLTARLETEERNSRFNGFRVNQEHLRRARDAKSAELRADAAAALPRFETSLASKQLRVARLVDELADAETQRKLARQSHADVVDELVKLQRRQLETLSTDFRAELQLLQSEFETEKRRLVDDHEAEMSAAAEVAFGIDAEIGEKERQMAMAFESKKFEVVGESMEDKFALRSRLEEKIEALWGQFRQTVADNEAETADARLEMDRLSRKDAESCAEIERRKRRIGRLEVEVERRKLEAQESAAERAKINAGIEAEKKRFVMELKTAKAALEKKRGSRAKGARFWVQYFAVVCNDLACHCQTQTFCCRVNRV